MSRLKRQSTGRREATTTMRWDWMGVSCLRKRKGEEGMIGSWLRRRRRIGRGGGSCYGDGEELRDGGSVAR